MAHPIQLPELRGALTLALSLLVTSAALADDPPAPAPPLPVDPAPAQPMTVDPAPAAARAEPDPSALETRIAATLRRVRTSPEAKAPLRAMIAPNEAFAIDERAAPGPGCALEGWGRVAADAWTCLDGTVVTTQAPRQLPVLLAFDPPAPGEAKDYLATRAWPRDPDAPPILPFVYAKERSRFSGDEYASLDDFLAGGPKHHVDPTRKLAFVEVIETEKGTVLRRESGHIVPMDAVWVFPVSRFQGVDLETSPAPDGLVPAWTGATAGTAIRALPDKSADAAWTLPFQGQVWVGLDAAHPGWLTVRDPSGAQPDGWVPARSPMHWWQDMAPPDGVGDAVWVDVDLDRNVLALRQGDRLLYATMVSTGVPDHETLPGVFRMMDKSAAWDMASLPDSAEEDTYHVEKVPWTMHFYPRFALHGAFWHDVFGSVVSHGCVNLAPRDAAWLFDRIHPLLEPSWWTAYSTPADPGSVVRTRHGGKAPKDYR